MNRHDHARARDAVASLNLNGANREVAEHWLSRWHNDRPPKRGSFDTTAIWRHKPTLMICRIGPGKLLRCVSGGAIIRLALGFDISNKDLLSLTPESERDVRLAYWREVVEGAVSVTYREFKSAEGQGGFAQGIGLPFSDEDADGARYFLMHTNWRPVGNDWIEGNVTVEIKKTSERRMVSFKDTGDETPI